MNPLEMGSYRRWLEDKGLTETPALRQAFEAGVHLGALEERSRWSKEVMAVVREVREVRRATKRVA